MEREMTQVPRFEQKGEGGNEEGTPRIQKEEMHI